MPEGSYAHHPLGIASVTSHTIEVTSAYSVVTANAGQFVRPLTHRYRNIAGSSAPPARNAAYVGKFPLTRHAISRTAADRTAVPPMARDTWRSLTSSRS